MLKRISKIKKEIPQISFKVEELVRTADAMEQMLIIDDTPSYRFRSPVVIRPIVDAEELGEMAIRSNSCLHKPYLGKTGERDAHRRFLEDPGALYLAIEAEGVHAYARMYAGEQAVSCEQLLFEDVLRSARPTDLTGGGNHPRLRAALALGLASLGFSDEKTYLHVEGSLREICEETKTLRVRKLGSDFFKKGHAPIFYKGIIPSFDPYFVKLGRCLEG